MSQGHKVTDFRLSFYFFKNISQINTNGGDGRRRVAHVLGKARPHRRPGRRTAGHWSSLWPYPPLERELFAHHKLTIIEHSYRVDRHFFRVIFYVLFVQMPSLKITMFYLSLFSVENKCIFLDKVCIKKWCQM